MSLFTAIVTLIGLGAFVLALVLFLIDMFFDIAFPSWLYTTLVIIGVLGWIIVLVKSGIWHIPVPNH